MLLTLITLIIELILVLLPTLAAPALLFSPPKLIPDTLICLCALQNNLQDGWRERVLSMIKKHFFKWSCTITYSLCLKKLLPTCYSLLNVLIMSFLIYISALDFILLDGADISSNTYILNHSEF